MKLKYIENNQMVIEISKTKHEQTLIYQLGVLQILDQRMSLYKVVEFASNTLKPDYPPHQGRELLYMGQDVQS